MKSLVTVSILAALGAAAAPVPAAALARSGDRAPAVQPASTLIVHACRDSRRYHGWNGYLDRSWGKRHRGHYGSYARGRERHDGFHRWHADKRGSHRGKHHKGDRSGHRYR